MNSPETSNFKLKSVKVCVSGSAPLPLAVQEKFGEITLIRPTCFFSYSQRRSTMSELIVIAYPEENRAEKVMNIR